jgi:hypothetical protein
MEDKDLKRAHTIRHLVHGRAAIVRGIVSRRNWQAVLLQEIRRIKGSDFSRLFPTRSPDAGRIGVK